MKNLHNSPFAERVLSGIIVLLFAGIVFATLSQVISRYVFNAPFMWTEEVARYLGIWCTMLTTGIVLGKKQHLAIDFVVEKLPNRLQHLMQAVVFFITGGFSLVLIVYGFSLVTKVAGNRSPALRIPMGAVYVAVPIGAIILLVYAVFGFIKEIPGIMRSSSNIEGE